MDDKISVGSRVKKIAKEKRIPLYILEEKAGIAKGSISKWDNINPSFDKVCRAARVLEVDINQLIS